MSNLEVMSDANNESDDALLPVNNLEIASIDENVSAELLVPENNLVVSIVNSTKSDGFLFDMNNLDVESNSNNESVELLDAVRILLVMSDKSNKSEKNLPIFAILPVIALIVIESENSLPRTVFLNIESMKLKLSIVLLEPDSVLVVSIVISITSLTLASMTAPAALDVMLFNESGSMITSARFLLAMSNLEIESINENKSDELLVPENNLVVSIVTRIISDGFLFAVNKRDITSIKLNVSSTSLCEF